MATAETTTRFEVIFDAEEQSLKPGIVKHRLKIGNDWVEV